MFNRLKATAKEQLDKGRQQLENQYQKQSQGQSQIQNPIQASNPSPAYWKATFQPGTSLDQDWRHETGANGWGNAELQDYTKDERNSHLKATTSGNALVLRAIVEPNRITSARLTSHQTLGRERGYLMGRITAPSAKGIWPAFWLLPREPFSWPTDGEVDIMESWNGLPQNHSCLHWGQYNGPDHDKHRVLDTTINGINSPAGHSYGFAWDEGARKLVWYLDERPMMRADIPQGIRRVSEFQIKLNIATGGNVCQGIRPEEGVFEMVVHEMGMFEAPPGGWQGFEGHCRTVPEGHGY